MSPIKLSALVFNAYFKRLGRLCEISGLGVNARIRQCLKHGNTIELVVSHVRMTPCCVEASGETTAERHARYLMRFLVFVQFFTIEYEFKQTDTATSVKESSLPATREFQ